MPFIEKSEKRILFIHIPKTGGTSIEKAMEKIAPLNLCARTVPLGFKIPPEHFTLHDIDALFNSSYFDFIFTIVRNPYHRIESEYRMRTLLAKDQLYSELPKFPLWLEKNLDAYSRNPHYLANHFRPQIEFLGKGVHVYRFEDGLEKIVNNVSKSIGVKIELPRKRLLNSSHVEANIDWTDRSIRAINKIYKDDFSSFGYSTKQPQFKKIDIIE